MTTSRPLDNPQSNQYEYLQNDILHCLGKSLMDDDFIHFIIKYKINSEDKHNLKLFTCSNEFLEFKNRDQRTLAIDSIKVKNNDSWLPYGLSQGDTVKEVLSKLGEPDISDYNYNVLWYYDKMIIISFNNIQDHNSRLELVTFSLGLKTKPPPEKLEEIRIANLKYLQEIEDKSFGYNSKWLVIKSSDLSKVCAYFNAFELSNWRKAFESTISSRADGVFVTDIQNYGILVHGWVLPEIHKNPDFYRELSSHFGDTFYFANHIKSPFSWAFFKNGELIRAYSEDHFEETINLGEEITLEKESANKRKELSREGEEYDSDQDIKIDYRRFTSELVLSIAKEWTFDPRDLSKLILQEKVHLNSNYRKNVNQNPLGK